MSEPACPFCSPDASRIFHSDRLVLGLWDAFPVSDGHALLTTRRHVESWFDASSAEHGALLNAIEFARRAILRSYRPDGFNIGVNVGPAAGQTVPHLHVHVIPRYAGDFPDPRGGVRWVLPSKANYLIAAEGDPSTVADDTASFESGAVLGIETPHDRALITGGQDPLLPHVRSHLARAQSADMAVAFLLRSGVALLSEHFRDLLDRKGLLRIVTGDYMGVTEPNALLDLLDLQAQYPNQLDLRVFRTEGRGDSFHPKAYLFHEASGHGVALVGSSNLTRTALTNGVEWNLRTVTAHAQAGFHAVRQAFESLLSDRRVRRVDVDWIDDYRRTRKPDRERVGVPSDPPSPPPKPHEIQDRALRALETTRAAGNSAGLVVLATGLGKTWLSAFDSNRTGFDRVLFVAHREEILKQAMATFRRIRPEAHLGLYTGQEKTPNASVLFASIQTLGRQAHLHRFAPDEFDYIVVDEFHHASARTYQRLLDYFTPAFLLGLTATPERTDGGDLLALCQENLVFRCDLAEGIRQGLLSPFSYFGVPDEVDYTNIPWRNRRFDERALEVAVATHSRAQNALEQYRRHGGRRALGFCCSVQHARFMRDHFRSAGLRATAVHSGEGSDPRAASLEMLQAGELDIVFAVDMFNEGVDVPDVDTILMLRPTESRILWLQQFGRGLRKAEGKERLAVVDYIGNHRTFLLKPQTLFDLPGGDARLSEHLTRLERREVDLPPGCEVIYDLKAIEILRGLLRPSRGEEALRFFYRDFRETNGVRPTATEMHHEAYEPRALRRPYGSWLGFVDSMGDLNERQRKLIREGAPAEFLAALETTEMTKSFKMLVLQAMLQANQLPGQLSLSALREGVCRIARRSGALRDDLAVPLEDPAAVDRTLKSNPIAAWTGGRGTGGTAYFEFADGVFRTTFQVDGNDRQALADLAREIVDWRLAEYLDRRTAPSASAHPEIGEAQQRVGLEIGRSYMRAEIPPAFGLEFQSNIWQQGFVRVDRHIFLLVTLDKSGMPQEHRYGDRFLSRELFEWKSQNRHTQRSAPGQAIRHHLARGIDVHLLVRKTRKIGSKAAPFIYCGDVEFEDWEGENPITVQWKLRRELTEGMAELFGVV